MPAAKRGELVAPFPYFGSKRLIASTVWEAFGDVDSYLEPFAGSSAVLLARPANHRKHVETINDIDGYLVNFWRAVSSDPEGVLRYVDFPVSQVDLHARHDYLLASKEKIQIKLRNDPEYYNLKMAGWWVWGICAWIGHGWCEKPSDQIPSIGTYGRGVHSKTLSQPFDGISSIGLKNLFSSLQERTRQVRILCGSWDRMLGKASLRPTGVPKTVGIFFDPPYAEGNMSYACGDTTGIGEKVREWCIAHQSDPDLRMVLCGYQGEHELPKWRKIYYNTNKGYGGKNNHREILWLSPSCLPVGKEKDVEAYTRPSLSSFIHRAARILVLEESSLPELIAQVSSSCVCSYVAAEKNTQVVSEYIGTSLGEIDHSQHAPFTHVVSASLTSFSLLMQALQFLQVEGNLVAFTTEDFINKVERRKDRLSSFKVRPSKFPDGSYLLRIRRKN
jgi:DNA adenine methylase